MENTVTASNLNWPKIWTGLTGTGFHGYGKMGGGISDDGRKKREKLFSILPPTEI
jgi:hypothetical protein